MLLVLFMLLVGICLLILGGKGIIKHAIDIAGEIKISPLIVGILVVGIGTSLPELVVTVFSGLDNANELALGNIIGSNITNIALIFGLTVSIKNVYIGSTKTQKTVTLYLILSLIFAALVFLSLINTTAGIILLLGGAASIIWEIRQGEEGSKKEDKKVIEKIKKPKSKLYLSIFYFIASLGMVVLGSKFLVDSGIYISKAIGIPEFLVGISVIALGTSIPEITVTIQGIMKNEDKLVVGDILGSNIYNVLLGVGIVGVFNSVAGPVNIFALLFFVYFSLLFFLIVHLFSGRNVPRFVGFMLLFFFVSYLGFVFFI